MKDIKYTVIFEQGPEGNWGAYVPDLPVVAGGADTREELELLMRDAIQLHVDDLKAQGLSIPEPVSHAAEIRVAA